MEMDEASFTWRGLRAGLGGAGAPAASSAIYGLAFGLLADQTGIGLWTAVLMSMTIYSGSAQFVTLQVWADPLPLATVCAAILAINARYVLLGASLRPWFGNLSAGKAYGTLFFLAEGSWAPAMREYRNGHRDAAYLLGAGLAMYVGWVGATAIGHALGQMIAEPRRLGLDFVLPGFFAVMAVALWRGSRDAFPFIVAAAVALVVDRFFPGHWHILAGGLAGSLVAAWKAVHAA
jgi:4-azaleucine resistance transporter AzlC